MNRKRYKKSEDKSILAEIKFILKGRSTYGYKRVAAMLNKTRNVQDSSIVNKKRIYRIMDMNGLIMKKLCTGKRVHKKTGKIITLHSNTRWCSDGFEIQCYNGEKVYVAFSLDCHDRECLSFVAFDRPLLATDIQRLMLESVENRFGTNKPQGTIQWLSDRGAIYRSTGTIQIARSLSMKSCFTAPYSPASNGMAESFVNKIKRDYVYTSDCHDAQTVLQMLTSWINDYNEVAPHSGLGMMSPVEYRRNMNLGV